MFYVPANTVLVIWETVLQVKRPNQQYQSTEGDENPKITLRYHQMLSMINSGATILGQLTTDKTADTCMSRRFPDTATYWPKIAKFSHRSFIRSSRYG